MNRISRTRHIAKTLGIRFAAGYARNAGLSIEAALWILLRR
jgi:hypothetical protein